MESYPRVWRKSEKQSNLKIDEFITKSTLKCFGFNEPSSVHYNGETCVNITTMDV